MTRYDAAWSFKPTTDFPKIQLAAASFRHRRVNINMSHWHDNRSGNQNLGNHIGTRSCVRQSRLYREYESGNAAKSIMGQGSLVWDVKNKQGAYQGQKVYDHLSYQREDEGAPPPQYYRAVPFSQELLHKRSRRIEQQQQQRRPKEVRRPPPRPVAVQRTRAPQEAGFGSRDIPSRDGWREEEEEAPLPSLSATIASHNKLTPLPPSAAEGGRGHKRHQSSRSRGQGREAQEEQEGRWDDFHADEHRRVHEEYLRVRQRNLKVTTLW